MTTEEFVSRWNAEHPDGPFVQKTDYGFTTVPYCKRFNGYTIHVGHDEGEPCALPEKNQGLDISS